MSIRLSKVRRTDYRPPSAGGKPPLERNGATRGGSLPGLTYGRSKVDPAHAMAVSGYSIDAALGIYNDLKRQMADPCPTADLWWIKKRYAAICAHLLTLQASLPRA